MSVKEVCTPIETQGAQARLLARSWLTVSRSFSYLESMEMQNALNSRLFISRLVSINIFSMKMSKEVATWWQSRSHVACFWTSPHNLPTSCAYRLWTGEQCKRNLNGRHGWVCWTTSHTWPWSLTCRGHRWGCRCWPWQICRDADGCEVHCGCCRCLLWSQDLIIWEKSALLCGSSQSVRYATDLLSHHNIIAII